MPKKGTTVSEQTRQKMAEAARSRDSILVRLYGFTDEFVRKQREEGFQWCPDCKSWHVGKSRRCKACSHLRNTKYYRENSELRKDHRRKYYKENREAQLEYRRKTSLRAYGVNQEWYEAKLAEQNGRCAICGNARGARLLAIDHNHICCATPKRACDRCRRGLLCDACNHALERVESIPDWAERAHAYLRRYALDGNASKS